MVDHYVIQVGVFVLLVCVQTFAILLFKLCQVNGAYTFSPASSVALTELCKLTLAGMLHAQSVLRAAVLENVSIRMVLHYLAMARLRGQQPALILRARGGRPRMSLGKSVAPYLCALLLLIHRAVPAPAAVGVSSSGAFVIAVSVRQLQRQWHATTGVPACPHPHPHPSLALALALALLALA